MRAVAIKKKFRGVEEWEEDVRRKKEVLCCAPWKETTSASDASSYTWDAQRAETAPTFMTPRLSSTAFQKLPERSCDVSWLLDHLDPRDPDIYKSRDKSPRLSHDPRSSQGGKLLPHVASNSSIPRTTSHHWGKPCSWRNAGPRAAPPSSDRSRHSDRGEDIDRGLVVCSATDACPGSQIHSILASDPIYPP